MRTVDVREWLNEQIGNRQFGPQPGKQGSNNNYTFTVFGEVKLKSEKGNVLIVPEGTEVCAYRPLRSSGHEIVATIFLPAEHVNIYAGGTWQRRKLPTGVKL